MKNLILVIEDNNDIRESVAELLKLEGYQIIEADSGEMALPLIQQHQPDLIICDIVLTGIDGYEILTRVKQSKLKIPFIFSSAKAEKQDRQKASDLGVECYLTKPFAEEELLQSVKSLIAE